MALFQKYSYRKPPDRVLEISERVYVFDCCFSSDAIEEDEYRSYMDEVVTQLRDYYPGSAFRAFNFKRADKKSQFSDILSQYGMTPMDYPQEYERCQLLPLEMIHHFLQSSESWLSSEDQQNVLLMHCEMGGWPVLAFMLAALLLYRKEYSGEQKTLDIVYKQAQTDLRLWTTLNPQPSQLRYLQYVSRREFELGWLASETPLSLDYIILRNVPLYYGGKGCRPVIHLYGLDPSGPTANRSSKLLFSSSNVNDEICFYEQEECELVKLDIHCCVQGDVVVECAHLEDDLVTEKMIFRIVFHTAFVPSNVLMLMREEVDIPWDTSRCIPQDFIAEVLFSYSDLTPPTIISEVVSEDGSETEVDSEEFFDALDFFSSSDDEFDSTSESDDSFHGTSWKDGLVASDKGRHRKGPKLGGKNYIQSEEVTTLRFNKQKQKGRPVDKGKEKTTKIFANLYEYS